MTKELSKRRLITVETREGQQVLSIHRKLQAKILDELNQPGNADERLRVFKRVFLLIRARFPRPSPAIWSPGTGIAWPRYRSVMRSYSVRSTKTMPPERPPA